MGVTTPSTSYVVELSLLFGVSTDYLLDMPETKTISVDGLTDREIASLTEIAECYRAGRRQSDLTDKAALPGNFDAIPEKEKTRINNKYEPVRNIRQALFFTPLTYGILYGII